MKPTHPDHPFLRQGPPRLRRVLVWSAVCAVLMLLGIGSVSADTYDCFPLCSQETNQQKPTVPAPQAAPSAPQTKQAETKQATTISACAPDTRASIRDTIDQVEALNDQVKPIKDIVGYVQSPQSLAMKLINDYVVKIPAWVGYIMDPVGSLKNRAIGEARDFAKDELKKSVQRDGSPDGNALGGEPLTTACQPITENTPAATPLATPEPKSLPVPGK